MPERATVLQFAQIAAETTPGVAPGAVPPGQFKRLLGARFEVQPAAEFQIGRGATIKYKTYAVMNKESSVITIPDSVISFNELPYFLCSTITNIGAPSTPPTATNARLWAFNPSSTAADNPKTLTIEIGDAVRAHRVSYGVLSELNFKWGRDAVTVGGSGFAQQLDDNNGLGITITAGAVDVPLVPIFGKHMNVFLDATHAAMGTTQLMRVMSAEFTITNRFAQVWTINSFEESYAAVYELEPEVTIRLRMQADSAGMAMLQQGRAGQTKYLSIQAIGDVIDATPEFRYRFGVNAAVKVGEPMQFADNDGLYDVEVGMIAVHDSTWGQAYSVTVQNTMIAL